MKPEGWSSWSVLNHRVVIMVDWVLERAQNRKINSDERLAFKAFKKLLKT